MYEFSEAMYHLIRRKIFIENASGLINSPPPSTRQTCLIVASQNRTTKSPLFKYDGDPPYTGEWIPNQASP